MKVQVCPEKQRLSDQLMEALAVLTQRQAEHAKAVVLLNDNWKRIEIALDEARMRLENVKKSYFAHVHEHGC